MDGSIFHISKPIDLDLLSLFSAIAPSLGPSCEHHHSFNTWNLKKTSTLEAVTCYPLALSLVNFNYFPRFACENNLKTYEHSHNFPSFSNATSLSTLPAESTLRCKFKRSRAHLGNTAAKTMPRENHLKVWSTTTIMMPPCQCHQVTLEKWREKWMGNGKGWKRYARPRTC